MNDDPIAPHPSAAGPDLPAIPAAAEPIATPPTEATTSTSTGPWQRLGRWGIGGFKWVVGALLSTFLVGSVIVVGWTTRAARRQVLASWWRRSPLWKRGVEFRDAGAVVPALATEAPWPNWMFGRRREMPDDVGRLARLRHRLVGDLMANLRAGIPMVFNTAVLTLPAGLLWAVSWFAGWQNSFNKGYEHAWFGPSVYILGMLLFTAAMAYVPLAQARQASTGDWRRFYDFALVARLIRRHWLASVALALAWAGASGVVLLLKLLPAAAQYVPQWKDASPAQALEISNRFFFLAALGLFPTFVVLRLLAARLYAHAVCQAFQSGAITVDDLGEDEWHALRRLELLTPHPQPVRHWSVRLARWLATRTGQLTAAAAVFFVWFSFSFLVAVSEFFCKTEWGRGWWNQPLIQLPWFDYTPQRLRQAAAESKTADSPTPSAPEPAVSTPELPE